MVVSKVEFNDAMSQINDSYKKLFDKVAKLEEQVSALQTDAKPARQTSTRSKANDDG